MLNAIEILKINNLAIGYIINHKKNFLFSDINLQAKTGELIALIGKNGIGKSTLLRCIARLQNQFSGEIIINNKQNNVFNKNEWAKTLSFVPTEKVAVNYLTVWEFVAYGRYPHTSIFSGFNKTDKKIISESLKNVNISDLKDKNINEISDGEKQKASIARALAQDSELIILDEPTAFLDLPNKYEIILLLNNLAKNNKKTIIFSTHDLNIALSQADKLWLMKENEIIEGAPEDLVLNKTIQQIFENKNLEFHEESGEFKSNRPAKQKVTLIGKGLSMLWTQKALERINLEVDNSTENSILIKIIENNGKLEWLVQNNQEKFSFKNIYNLILHIDQIIQSSLTKN